MSDETFDTKGLDQLIKALKNNQHSLKVGILGSDTTRRDGQSDNATIGAVHEFGSPARNIPQRSFLRMPLAEHLYTETEKSKLLDPDTMKQTLEMGSFVSWLEKIGTISVGIVLDAFETSGDGKWPQWKDPNYSNQGGMLLVDTQQLRDSISYEVK